VSRPGPPERTGRVGPAGLIASRHPAGADEVTPSLVERWGPPVLPGPGEPAGWGPPVPAGTGVAHSGEAASPWRPSGEVAAALPARHDAGLPGWDDDAAPGSSAAAWQRLHPLSPLVRVGRALFVFVVPVVAIPGGGSLGPLLLEAALLVAVVAALGAVSWLVTRWRIDESVLRIDSGLLRRSSRRFPLGRVQAVDVVEPLLARVFGLAELRVRAAGSTGSAGRLAYLSVADAQRLRAEILALARPGSATNAEQSAPRRLVSIDTTRLGVSLLLSAPGVATVVAGLAVGALAVAGPSPLRVELLPLAAAGLLGAGTDVARRLNSGYRLRVEEAHDGFRVRSGLFQTTAETIPLGRVQVVRVLQPLLWRAFGWYRVEVVVAGHQRDHGENEAEGRARRSLLPVGRRGEVEDLLARLVPGAPVASQRPPRRARWKSPLRYRRLGWGADAAVLVTTSGRLRRVTHYVPLAKVQGIRLVVGPLQRRMGLGTIHLDTAGHSLHAALHDRDRAECLALVEQLSQRCRQARQHARRPGAGSGAGEQGSR